MSLRDLDDRLLPRTAARVRAWVDRLTDARRAGEAWVAGVDLRRLDERLGRGPLGPVTRHPVVGLVVALAVAFAGVGVAVDRERGDRGPTVPVTPSAGVEGLQGATLGPAVGADVTGYVRTSTEGLVRAVHDTPRSSRVALLSLSSYLTPEGLQLVLRGFTAPRVFLRAPAAGANATTLPVEVRGDLLAALRKAYADTARSRASAATSYQGYVDTLTGSSPEDVRFRALYTAFAQAAKAEAKAYGAGCACVYAALVVATPAQLLTLRQRPGVRALEVAPAGRALAEVQVRPLLPEVTGTVPRPTVAGLP